MLRSLVGSEMCIRDRLISPPRTLPAPSTTNFYGLLRLQQRPYRPRKPHRHRFALGAPQHHHSRPTTSFHRTIGFHQRSYHIFRGYHDATASGLERLPVPSRPPLAFPSDLSWSPYIIGSLNDPDPITTVVQPAHYAPSRHAIYGSASLQRQETGSLAHRVLSNSAPPVLFFFTPVAAVDNSLDQPRVRVQFWDLIIFPSVTTF